MTSEDIAKAYGMMSVEEVALLKRCARIVKRKDPVIVNIGAGFGTSTIAFLETHPNAHVYSVDIQDRPEEFENLRKCGIDENKCSRLKGKSWMVADNFELTIDILFVDGDHSAEAVKKDIAAWLPKVRVGGIVLFHDYEHYNVPKLTDVVNEAMKEQNFLGKNRFLAVYQLVNGI